MKIGQLMMRLIPPSKDAAFSEWLTKLKEATEVIEFDRWKERVPSEPSITQ